MVWVIVEDCVDKVFNRFDLVFFVVYCVRVMLVGELIIVECDNDKNLVVVFWEIVDEGVIFEMFCEEYIIFL